MNIYSVLVHIHSGLRWLVLLAMVISVAFAVYFLIYNPPKRCKSAVINRFAMILMHLQLLIGLVLYFISPKVVFDVSSMKDKLLRFFLVEHITLMVIAVILVTIGYVKAQRTETVMRRDRRILVYYSIALLVILASIPWPFRNLGAGWF